MSKAPAGGFLRELALSKPLFHIVFQVKPLRSGVSIAFHLQHQKVTFRITVEIILSQAKYQDMIGFSTVITLDKWRTKRIMIFCRGLKQM